MFDCHLFCVGIVGAIDHTEADAIGAELISEYNLCLASLPAIEKYELKEANIMKYQALALAQKFDEAKAVTIEIKAMGPCALPDGFSSSKDVIRRVGAVRQKIDARRLALLADTSDIENLSRVTICIEYGVKVDAFLDRMVDISDTTKKNAVILAEVDVVPDISQPTMSSSVETASPKKQHVYLSYAWGQKDFVVEFGKALKNKGYEVWRDEEGSALVPPMSGNISGMSADEPIAGNSLAFSLSYDKRS